ncbi:MAG: hypothetical protein AB4060_03605 [Crocosphaera sp.]
MGVFFIFNSPSFYLQRKTVESEALAAIGYLRVVEGTGSITKSNYPQIVPPQTTTSKVNTGAYNPQKRTIILNIQDRRVELKLKAPLVENKPIQFTAKYAGRFSYEAPPLLTAFPSIMAGLALDHGFQTQGTLEKKQNQINGRFDSSAFFSWWSGESPGTGLPDSGNGSVSGQFTLKVQPGQQSDLLPPPVPALW